MGGGGGGLGNGGGLFVDGGGVVGSGGRVFGVVMGLSKNGGEVERWRDFR